MSNFILNHGIITLILVSLFVLGAIFGSFVNVWIARLPLDKSVLWPNSRCGNCLQAINWYDNVPLISYWVLRGRCRNCGASYSIRYFFVELLIAAAFPLLFYLEIVKNIHGLPAFEGARFPLTNHLFGKQNLPYFVFFVQHAILFCFLVAAAGCDLSRRTIPLSLTVTGTIIGLVFATLLPWPWPNTVAEAMPHPRPGIEEWWLLMPTEMQKPGLYPWPVWGPLPHALAPGSWRLGLVTGLAGALAGTFLLRAVKFLFERGLGKEALGLGDADLMMMVGAFLGWQPVVIAFLLGGVVSLIIALPNLMLRNQHELPFGPGLAIGSVITWLTWSWTGPRLQVVLFNPMILGVFGVGCAAVLLLLSFLFGMMQRPEPRGGSPPGGGS